MTDKAVVVGGYHDGVAGVVADECVHLGFVAMESADGETWHGYFNSEGERDDQGRLVFRAR